MRVSTLLAATLSLSCLQAGELTKLPPETMGLIDGARGLAPEFGADLLLRLADSTAITDIEWRRRLIDEAFTVAAHAQMPYRKHAGNAADSRYTRQFWPNDLESLSLQAGAVEAMLAIDPQHAREMFDDIPTPDVPALTCQETGVPDLRAYYETAKDVFAHGFSAEQRKKSLDLDFLDRMIGNMRSPADVSQALNMVNVVSVTAAQRLDLYTRFAGMLDHINGTPRLFFANNGFGFQTPTPPVLALSLRGYIVRHLKGPRCSDAGTGMRNAFNNLSGKLDPGAVQSLTITEDEVKPGKDEGTYERHVWWTSNRSKQVIAALKWLDHDDRVLAREEQTGSEWNAHFIETLKLIEGWGPDEEDSPDDWFGMVSESYRLLAGKAPREEQREAAMKRYLNFMETQYAGVESHNLWFTQLNGLWHSKDTWTIDRFAESKNLVIALYAKIARLRE